MTKIFLLGSLFGLLLNQCIYGQIAKKNILDGHLVDNVSGKPIPFAHVQIADYNFATITDENGWFRIMADSGEYHFYFSHISYELSDRIISISSDTTLLIYMEKKTVMMEEVVVRGEKIVNLTPERYSHVSDYEVINNKLLLIGHPSKRLKSYLYLAGLSGTINDTLPIEESAYLEKDYNSIPWLVKSDSATQIKILNNKIYTGETISLADYNDSVSCVLLKWDSQKYYQNTFPGEKGLKTYYQKPDIDSLYIISDIKDSLLLFLEKNKARDQYARREGDMAESLFYHENYSETRPPGRGQTPIISRSGAEAVYYTWGKTGSRYITFTNEEPLIYGSGKFGSMNITIPEIKNIYAPIFMFKNILLQIDYYNEAINFYNKTGILIHKVPISFHVKKQYGGALRDIYSPLVDEVNNEVYVWTQKINQVEIYQLDVETGELIKKINLDSYKNIQKPRIENGNLYFMYSEEHYPYATRLYSMVL